MPEAKSSVTYALVSKNGLPLMFTVRASDEGELLEEMEQLETSLVKNGYTGDRKVGFVAKPKEVVVGEKCPKCSSPLVKFTSKDGTKSGIKCSAGKWDFETKKTIGCDFVRWNDADTSVNGEATPAQKAILVAKGVWQDGMTKSQANELIGQLLGK